MFLSIQNVIINNFSVEWYENLEYIVPKYIYFLFTGICLQNFRFLLCTEFVNVFTEVLMKFIAKMTISSISSRLSLKCQFQNYIVVFKLRLFVFSIWNYICYIYYIPNTYRFIINENTFYKCVAKCNSRFNSKMRN